VNTDDRRAAYRFNLQKYSLRLMLGVSFLIFFVIFAYGCSYEEWKLKQEIIDASNKSNAEQISLDLSKFTDGNVKNVCVQRQYMTQKLFIKLTKMDAPGFSDIVDGGKFILWVYFDEKPSIQVSLKNSEVMEPERGLCSGSSIIHIKQEAIVFVSQEE
jgi:hypothetical protein